MSFIQDTCPRKSTTEMVYFPHPQIIYKGVMFYNLFYFNKGSYFSYFNKAFFIRWTDGGDSREQRQRTFSSLAAFSTKRTLAYPPPTLPLPPTPANHHFHPPCQNYCLLVGTKWKRQSTAKRHEKAWFNGRRQRSDACVCECNISNN